MREKSELRRAVQAGILAILLTSAAAAFAQNAPNTVTLTGWVSCAMCVLPNACKAKTRTECVSWWVNQGGGYVLVVGTRNYRLLGADDRLKRLAGRTITITGEQFRSDFTVTSVEPNTTSGKNPR